MNEWVRLSWADRKIVATDAFLADGYDVSPSPLAPAAFDLLWNSFKMYILEIPHSSQAQISHVSGLQKSPSRPGNIWLCLTSFFATVLHSCEQKAAFCFRGRGWWRGKARSCPTRQRREGEEILGMGTFIPFSGSWLWTILVVLTSNLKPQWSQGSQEDGLLAQELPKQHKYPLFISNLLLY